MDSKGLITADRKGLQEHKKCKSVIFSRVSVVSDFGQSDFARTDYNGPPLTNLIDIIGYVRPTALLGLSTIRVCVLIEIPFSLLFTVHTFSECFHGGSRAPHGFRQYSPDHLSPLESCVPL